MPKTKSKRSKRAQWRNRLNGHNYVMQSKLYTADELIYLRIESMETYPSEYYMD